MTFQTYILLQVYFYVFFCERIREDFISRTTRRMYVYRSRHKNSRNIKFLFELLGRTCVSPTALRKVSYPRASFLWNLQQEMSLTEMSLRSRTRERKMKKRPGEGDLFRPAGHVSDPNKRPRQRSAPRARDQIWEHREGHWADSCFLGSRSSRASRSNKTIPYDLYLWALRHLIAAARARARADALAGTGLVSRAYETSARLHARARMRRRS